MKNIIEKVRTELKNNIDEKRLADRNNFFKEEIELYGVKVPVVHKISKELFQLIKSKTRQEIFEYCEIFWQSGYIEESIVACNWSYYVHKQFEPKDFETFERWISNYVSNWATCDTFCNHTVGAFIEMYPEFLTNLKAFTVSENRWMRRAAAVILIIPARRGRFLIDIMEIASLLLTDKDDLVQKGYGWMLKAASEAHQKEIFDFVMVNKTAMPRTALRYAIEKMPMDLKAKAMEK